MYKISSREGSHQKGKPGGHRLRTPMHQNCLQWGGMEGKFHRAERERNISPAYTTRARGPWKMPTPTLLTSFFSNGNHSTEELNVVFVCLSVCLLVLYCHATREWLRSEQPGKNVCDGSSIRKILDKSDRACEELRRERSCGREVPSPPQCFEALEMEETQWRVLSCGNNRLSLQSRESSPTKTQQWVQLKPMGSENVWIINIWQGRGWDSV